MSLHVKVYGATVASPSLIAPLKNSTFDMLPPGSLALAEMLIVAGAAKFAPFIGLIKLTFGPDVTWYASISTSRLYPSVEPLINTLILLVVIAAKLNNRQVLMLAVTLPPGIVIQA